MSQTPAAIRLVEALEKLAPHDHLCLIYENPAEQFQAIAPFLRLGLERGEQCIYVADDNTTEVVLAAMRIQCVDIDSWIDAGAFILTGTPQTYFKEDYFDPDGLMRFWTDKVEAARAAGYKAMRLAAEMTGMLRPHPGAEQWVEYEAKLNRFFPQVDALAVCQYNRRQFQPELIVDVLRTHPLVVFDELVCKNFYYVPPDEFLAPDNRALEVTRQLHTIVDRARIEEELIRSKEQAQAYAQRLQSLMQRLLEVQEAERRRIAHELHDEIGQLQVAAKMNLELVQQQVGKTELAPLIQETIAMINRAVEQGRSLMVELRPPVLDELGLAAAVQEYVERQARRAGWKSRLRIEVYDRLPADIEITCFRIMQEALANVTRHAAAHHVYVELRQQNGELQLTVRDDGVGFDLKEARRRASRGACLGLLGMTERAQLVDGRVEIESAPGKGTKVRAQFPLPAVEEA